MMAMKSPVLQSAERRDILRFLMLWSAVLLRGEVFEGVFYTDFADTAVQHRFQLPAFRAGVVPLLIGLERSGPVPGTLDDGCHVAPFAGSERRRRLPPSQFLCYHPLRYVAVT